MLNDKRDATINKTALKLREREREQTWQSEMNEWIPFFMCGSINVDHEMRIKLLATA